MSDLQNEYDITLNQIKNNEKLREEPVDIATSCIREDDRPLFTLPQVVCKNSSSGLNEDLEQSSIMKLSGDKLQQINNLIKNFQDLSLFIEQALLS
ncbi:MAG: hypothetical protein LN588_05570 [Rickettsia endosymbiont of Bryobia graminum]|nr:hypothetical protein [Rickettsia endosymbiont of Bryobia graminum]